MSITHQQSNAVVCAGQYESSFSGMQAFRPSATECISQNNGVIPLCVGCVDSILESRAHSRTQVVQSHREEFDVNRMRGGGDDLLHLACEDLTTDYFQAHGVTKGNITESVRNLFVLQSSQNGLRSIPYTRQHCVNIF
jgi:hypothetical protein